MTPEGIFRMAVFDGMRPGEILAVRLGRISLYSILIDRRVYKGDVDSPKGRKVKRSTCCVARLPGTKGRVPKRSRSVPGRERLGWPSQATWLSGEA